MPITQYDIERSLVAAGLRYKVGGRYIHTQCPLHDDQNESCQIFLDDFFCSCLAGCGRFPITKAFPELKGPVEPDLNRLPPRRVTNEQHTEINLWERWSRLPLLPETTNFKGIPVSVLTELGWRYDESQGGYFIPYFNQSRDKIPFGQWRHLQGERRFSFLAGARQTLYGKWNIAPGERLFIVEGTSDCAVLERCGVPWLGAPSASSGRLLQNFAKHAQVLGIDIVYAGDRDKAGDALKEALDQSGAHYRTRQVPQGYKDWGEFYQDQGDLAVLEWCKPILME